MELMVTIAIMGIAFVAILTGVAIAISASGSHRAGSDGRGRRAQLRRTDQRSQGHAVRRLRVPGAYQNPSGFELPSAGWSATVTSVAYLQPGDPPQGYGGGCAPDLGAQQITLQVNSPSGRNAATETLVIVKRARCGRAARRAGARRGRLHPSRAHHGDRDPGDHHRPPSLALITGLRVVGKADEKYNDSRGSLISAAYFANDVSNANTITKGASRCGGTGSAHRELRLDRRAQQRLR